MSLAGLPDLYWIFWTMMKRRFRSSGSADKTIGAASEFVSRTAAITSRAGTTIRSLVFSSRTCSIVWSKCDR